MTRPSPSFLLENRASGRTDEYEFQTPPAVHMLFIRWGGHADCFRCAGTERVRDHWQQYFGIHTRRHSKNCPRLRADGAKPAGLPSGDASMMRLAVRGRWLGLLLAAWALLISR